MSTPEGTVSPPPAQSEAPVAPGTPRASHRPVLSNRRMWLILATVLAVEVMDLVDSTVVNVAAPSIRNELHGTYSSIQWIAAGYTLAFAVMLITGGRLGDIYGRRRLFIIGAAGFTLSSALCAIAPTMSLLIAFRILEGGFGAIMIPQGLGIIRTTFPADKLTQAFGAYGPVLGLSAMLGPIIAGSLISANLWHTGWRMIFFINLPLGVFAVVSALRYMPESKSPLSPKLDIVGVLILSVASVLVIFPLVQGRELGWPLWTFVLMALAIPVVFLFVFYERRRQESPLIEVGMLTERGFSFGLVVMFVFFLAMTGYMLVFGLFAQIGLGFSPLKAGLTFAPWTIGLAISAGVAGAVLAPKLGRKLIVIGLVVLAVGVLGMYVTLAWRGADVTAWDFVPAGFVAGLGMGCVFAPMFGIALAGVKEHEVGSASGLLNASQQYASAIGVAVIATIFFSLLASHAISGAQASEPQFRAALTAAAVPTDQQDALVNGFTTCGHDQAAENDPSVVPASCIALRGQVEQVASSPAQAEAIGVALQNVSQHAVKATFVDAMKPTILITLLLFLLTIPLTFLLPKYARPEEY